MRENKFHTYLTRETLPAEERVSKFHNHGKTPSYQTFAVASMRKVVPKSLRKSLEGIEGPSSFLDWDRVSLSPFVNLSTVMGVSMGVSKPQTADRRPQTADRSSHLKLQNEDLRQNALW